MTEIPLHLRIRLDDMEHGLDQIRELRRRLYRDYYRLDSRISESARRQDANIERMRTRLTELNLSIMELRSEVRRLMASNDSAPGEPRTADATTASLPALPGR